MTTATAMYRARNGILFFGGKEEPNIVLCMFRRMKTRERSIPPSQCPSMRRGHRSSEREARSLGRGTEFVRRGNLVQGTSGEERKGRIVVAPGKVLRRGGSRSGETPTGISYYKLERNRLEEVLHRYLEFPQVKRSVCACVEKGLSEEGKKDNTSLGPTGRFRTREGRGEIPRWCKNQ